MIQTLLIICLLCGRSAFAGEWWVETPAVESRAESARHLRTIAGEGYNARLVRSYRHGFGYEFRVLLTGFASALDAENASMTVANLLGVPVSVFAHEQKLSSVAADPSGEIVSNHESGSERRMPLSALLERLAWSLDREEWNSTLELAEEIDFRFRVLNSRGETEYRRYLKAGEHISLERSSQVGHHTVVLDGSRATYQENEGETRQITATYARNYIQASAPSVIVNIGTRMVSEILNPERLTELRRGEPMLVDGEVFESILGTFGPSRVPVSVTFEPDTFCIRQVVIGSGGDTWVVELESYHEEVNGLNVPHVIRVWFKQEIFYSVQIEDISTIFRSESGLKWAPGQRE